MSSRGMSEPDAIRPPSMARDAIVTTLTAFDGVSGAAVADASLPFPQPANAMQAPTSAAICMERSSERIVDMGYLRTVRRGKLHVGALPGAR